MICSENGKCKYYKEYGKEGKHMCCVNPAFYCTNECKPKDAMVLVILKDIESCLFKNLTMYKSNPNGN